MKKFRTRSGLAMTAGLSTQAGAQIGGPGLATRYLVECRGPDGALKWVETFHNLVVNSGLNDLLDKYFKGAAYTASHFVGLIGANTGTVAISSGSDAITGTGTPFAAADVGSDILIVGAAAASADLFTTIDNFTSATSISLAANAGSTVSGVNYAVEPRGADTMAAKSFSENTAYSNATRPALTLGTVAGQSVSNSANRAQFDVNATTRVFGAFVTTNNTKGGTAGTLYGGGLFSASRLLNNGDTLFVTVTLTASAS